MPIGTSASGCLFSMSVCQYVSYSRAAKESALVLLLRFDYHTKLPLLMACNNMRGYMVHMPVELKLDKHMNACRAQVIQTTYACITQSIHSLEVAKS